MESRKNVHWPSCFWFFLATLSAVEFAMSISLPSLLRMVGFACMGYSSIRLVPGDQFTRKFPFFARGEAQVEYRRIDVVTQFAGLALMATSLLISYGANL